MVDLIHQSFGGFRPGARSAHANGRIYAGTLTAPTAKKSFSRAAHFQGTPAPVTVRVSGGSGDPSITAGATVAMTAKF